MTREQFPSLEKLPILLTTQQAADYLQVSIGTVKKLIGTGELKAKKLGAGWRIREVDLKEFLLPDNIDSDTEKVTNELIADLRSAAAIIREKSEDQRELVSRLFAQADRLVELNTEAAKEDVE